MNDETTKQDREELFWDWCGSYGVVSGFAGGGDVCLQGEEGAALDDQIEACETDEQIQELLSQYSLLVD